MPSPYQFTWLWRESELFRELREPQSAGARELRDVQRLPGRLHWPAKFSTGPSTGLDTQRVVGHGDKAPSSWSAGAPD